MTPVRAHRMVAVADRRLTEGTRPLPEEVAIALTYNGSTQAVMMATPADLDDFARGFTLTEGIADPAEIESIEVVDAPKGVDLQIWLKPDAATRLAERRRMMTGPVGCGLCGLDSLEEALRAPDPVRAELRVTPDQIIETISALPGHQPLHDAARALHAAAFWVPGRGVVLAREDVGRHNAVDKLAGGLLALGEDGGAGAIFLTSRLSVDLVQKIARIGASLAVAISAPTGAALELAESCGLTVVAMARPDGFEIYTHPRRITVTEAADVA